MRYMKQKEYLFLVIMLSAVLFVTGFELKFLQTELFLKKIVTKEIDYEAFRKCEINDAILTKAEVKVAHMIKNNPDLKEIPYFNKIGYLTFHMIAASGKLMKIDDIDDDTISRGICRLTANPQFQELYGYYKAVISDLVYFPVPKVTTGDADIDYVNSWYQPRTYGGDRKHEGTDLMASNNLRGFFPVISITDGTVEKMGWLEQGGYRIGIRAASGGYFYYAHLYSYAPDLKLGDNVIAGQLLGFMGDSGYGDEGTIGQFDVHLHMGIYVNTKQSEMSVNPYYILRMLEKKRTVYNNN